MIASPSPSSRRGKERIKVTENDSDEYAGTFTEIDEELLAEVEPQPVVELSKKKRTGRA
jgi:hypothetical protein